MTLKTGAVFLAEQLEAYGVTHVFMVPAVSYTHLRAHET